MSERMLAEPFDLVFEPRRMIDPATGELNCRRSRREVVRDLEALVRGVLGAERWPCFLEDCDNAELLAHLLGESVILEQRYRPRDGIEARPWLFQRLRYAARDWRDSAERHRVLGELPRLDSADDPDVQDGGIGLARRAGDGGSSARAIADAAPGDRRNDGLDDLRRLLESGDRALLREVEALGLGPPPGARGRTHRARCRLAALERKRRERVARLDRVAA